MQNRWWKIILAIFLAGIVADYLHIHSGIDVPSYLTLIEIWSYLTKPLEAAGVALIYYLLGDRLPTRSRLIKGLFLTLIVLLTEGQLIRQLFMNLLLPNTLREALAFQRQVWLSHLAMCLIITLLIIPKYGLKEKPVERKI